MSSDSIEEELIAFVQDDRVGEYALIAPTVVLVYDYLLNFSLEVPLQMDLIWNRKFSSTTLAFIVVWDKKPDKELRIDVYLQLRYMGLMLPAFFLVNNFTGIPLSSKLLSPSGVGYILFAVPQAMIMTIMILLQGMMSIRVYVLLGKPQNILVVFAVFYIVVQGINIATLSVMLRGLTSVFSEISFAGIYSCYINFPEGIWWIYPTSDAFLISYEALLCALALCVLMSIIVNAMEQVKDNINLTAYNCFEDILEVVLYCMVGPWMILSLRKSYEIGLGREASNGHELTTVAFAPPVAQPAEEDGYGMEEIQYVAGEDY
ncbi:hypothetical protein CONPUDRAFT_74389 [Coniophora puteana RWD-64-598 SS2]|uniref:DUF6533 domain-containing protein n=1 Tax=Coniophora puteana (strain RWD-64-598) TaxID=741705 RepID=A0A5M3MIF6_CONPW|nr:uncharacterized protein CONPUDRAFT_74389 [Coniophora puteana RWD-64-598 SS2]EIW78786.1 hypothetical protein CONPUDRAFT_74389 [Coniophora puteana RWD-64-598 SS2]